MTDCTLATKQHVSGSWRQSMNNRSNTHEYLCNVCSLDIWPWNNTQGKKGRMNINNKKSSQSSTGFQRNIYDSLKSEDHAVFVSEKKDKTARCSYSECNVSVEGNVLREVAIFLKVRSVSAFYTAVTLESGGERCGRAEHLISSQFPSSSMPGQPRPAAAAKKCVLARMQLLHAPMVPDIHEG